MISIIIPVYNEEKHIVPTIELIRQHDTENLVSEIIVSDGGSKDDTINTAALTNCRVISSPRKGRAAQMNYGAEHAKENLLYFIHADTIPPKGFSTDVKRAIQSGAGAGCFMLAFDHDHWFLRTLCWFTRFNVGAFRYGDQSLFIRKPLFRSHKGFREDHVVMEDYELVTRISDQSEFIVIKKPVITSARKYLENGLFKTQAVFFLIFFMYKFGYTQQKLVSTYRKLIKQDKL
ncbi:TIGR04283 family arsenosugar biosynthesis glycosyltransferase [Flavitalea antarctica]